MNPLVIDPSETTPYVLFDNNKGTMEIKGASFDEDSTEFYSRLYQWLDQYRKNPNSSIILNMHFKYMNSSSSYSIFELLKRFQQLKQGGSHVTINWFYSQGDEDIRSAGEEFSDLINLPFNIKRV